MNVIISYKQWTIFIETRKEDLLVSVLLAEKCKYAEDRRSFPSFLQKVHSENKMLFVVV